MKPLKERIINLDNRDYHMHTSTFSDGIPTFNEIADFAGKIGLTEIAITDHSQAAVDIQREEDNRIIGTSARYSMKHWKNVYNDVNIIIWVEWDLLNDAWDVCFHIQGKEPDFIILSAHKDVYKSPKNTVTDATVRAIDRYHEKIKFIWHPCNNSDFWKYYDIERLVEVANKYDIGLEMNASKLEAWKTDLDKLDYLLKHTNKIYLNSDAHTLFKLKTSRNFAIEWLKENNYL